MLQRITPEICLCATTWSSDMSWRSLSEMACHERSMCVAFRKQRGACIGVSVRMTSGGHECILDRAAICALAMLLVSRYLPGRKVPENGCSYLPDYLGLIESRWLRMAMFEWGNVLERASLACRSGRLTSLGYWTPWPLKYIGDDRASHCGLMPYWPYCRVAGRAGSTSITSIAMTELRQVRLLQEVRLFRVFRCMGQCIVEIL